MASLRLAAPPVALGLALALSVAGCAASAAAPVPSPATRSTPDEAPSALPAAPPAPAEAPPPPPAPSPEPPAAPRAPERPPWLGTRLLPLRPDGFGEIQPTPPELRDRRLPPGWSLPPAPGDVFAMTMAPVPPEVADRSTWSPACPVALDDLRYLTLSFWGFDDRTHIGELLVHALLAEDVAAVFRQLYDARFPIEEMRIVAPAELEAPPTGDGNNTTAFVCRPATGGVTWSQHAYGLAVDVNPFHNPYVKGDLVVPELASAYVDRARQRPGMITPDDAVTRAFTSIGWQWGGTWRSAKDFMHFSANGR